LLVDDLPQLPARHGASDGADKACEQCACQTAEGEPGRPGECAKRSTGFRTRKRPCRSPDSPEDAAQDAAGSAPDFAWNDAG
jgi:hypothetical protein